MEEKLNTCHRHVHLVLSTRNHLKLKKISPKHSTYPPLVPTYYFPLHTFYFSLYMHSLIIHVIIYFGRIIIDIIVLRKEKKTRIILALTSLFLWKEKRGVLFLAFTHNSRHYLFWKDNNWYHCFMKVKERCVLFFERK